MTTPKSFEEFLANDEGVRRFGLELRPEWIDAARAGWDAAMQATCKEHLQVAQQAERKPLTDEAARKLCHVGAVYAPDGVVTRVPQQYRSELEAAKLTGFRAAEQAHGIK